MAYNNPEMAPSEATAKLAWNSKSSTTKQAKVSTLIKLMVVHNTLNDAEITFTAEKKKSKYVKR